MAISKANFYMFKRIFPLLKRDRWSDVCMCEFGNQRLSINRKIRPAKKYFKSLGCKHTSFDLNGLDGAIKVDLSKPIDKGWYLQFDIVTSEHVGNQHIVFMNAHNICKIGGFMTHSIPLDGNWPHHCPYRYKKDFPKYLSEALNYKLVYCDIIPKPKRKNRKLLNFILQKLDDDEKQLPSDIPEITYTKEYKTKKDNLYL